MSHSKNSIPPIAIIGVGNYLLQDEGTGIHAVDILREKGLPQDVEIIDGATAGPGLRFFMENRRKIIFIDAGNFGGEPGDYIRFTPNEAESAKELDKLSLHEFDLLTFLKESQHIREQSSIIIYCIQPKCIAPGIKLSQPVQKGLKKLVVDVIAEVKK